MAEEFEEAYISGDPRRPARSMADFGFGPSPVSKTIVVERTDGGCRVLVNGIDITYWMAAGSAPAISFPEGKSPVLTVHLTAEDFQIRGA